MNTKALLLIAMTSVLFSGCDRGAQQPVDATRPADTVAAADVDTPKPAVENFTGPRAPANSDQVEAAVAEGVPTPLRMSGGQTIAAAFTPDRNGTLLAFGVRIGNSRGASDGSLSMNFCQKGACQDVAVPLPGTRDNGYLIFNLTTPVEVVAGETYDFKLSRSNDATKPVAIWTHPAPAGSRTLMDVNNVDTGRVARLVFYFKK